ncbi:MAG TPA: hypothetical protein VFO10_18065 [Oligoflexus sp.]|uniref:hypothetical protein n=1 Tax=Oligoflexus sp. TaxID=1971216 RepID=UPI002D808867|nr:hypothetical protein [Oligoflexus sp.]HET9239171.1 hypothetical protein [Oligoflexus sp.]
MSVFSISVCASRIALGSESRADALKFGPLVRAVEAINSFPDERRPLAIKMLLAVSISAHAKVVADPSKRGRLYELKNRLYLDIVNGPERRLVSFRHLKSSRSKVLEKCAVCAAEGGIRCRACKVDYSYFDLLQITHLFDSGSFTLVISNDRVARIERFDRKRVRSMPMPDITEQLICEEAPLKCRHLRALGLEFLIVAAEAFLATSRSRKAGQSLGLRQVAPGRRIRVPAMIERTA